MFLSSDSTFSFFLSVWKLSSAVTCCQSCNEQWWSYSRILSKGVIVNKSLVLLVLALKLSSNSFPCFHSSHPCMFSDSWLLLELLGVSYQPSWLRVPQSNLFCLKGSSDQVLSHQKPFSQLWRSKSRLQGLPLWAPAFPTHFISLHPLPHKFVFTGNSLFLGSLAHHAI